MHDPIPAPYPFALTESLLHSFDRIIQPHRFLNVCSEPEGVVRPDFAHPDFARFVANSASSGASQQPLLPPRLGPITNKWKP